MRRSGARINGMSLFGYFFEKKKSKSVVLIDIGIGSVAGACATITPGGSPVLLYTRRLPIEPHSHESHEKAMLRALTVLGEALVREGAPALMRATGTGTADTILVSIDAPWQTTSVRTEHFEQDEAFLFTKDMVTKALEKASNAPEGKILVDESIIGTVLNGYETRDPYGKQTSRAAIIILTSFIDESIAEHIHTTLRSLYHVKNTITIAGSSLRYQAMRIAFPHERDALILDATDQSVALALVRKGLLVNVTEIQNRTKDITMWVENVTNTLKDISKHFPLPRTIFLLTREPDITSLREVLDGADLGKLWLSDNPPKIVSVLGSHLTSLVRQATTTTPDISLLLMALFYRQVSKKKEEV